MSEVSRRAFIQTAAVGTAAATIAAPARAAKSPNEKIRVAVIGIRGRGKDHMNGFQKQPNVEITTICDVDESLFEPRIKEFFTDRGLSRPKTVTDMREIMEDDSIDVVSVATPNHWHSLAAIWAIQAGKDVYCEKPCSHNIFEGRQLANAAKKYGRCVQHGTQIRSNPAIREAIQHIKDGLLGEVYMARGLCYRWRPTIGEFPDSEAPDGVDYNLWLGPAAERPFNENRFHYNWHYMWDYGNGDIGNQGVHQMDVCRWGLGVDLPSRVSSASGMFIYDDQKEVPNVINSSFDFPDAGERGKMMVFDVRPYHTNDEKGAKVGILFYGSEGYMVIDSYSSYRTYLGQNGKPGPKGNVEGDHYANFIEAVRAQDPALLHAPIEEGHYSSGLCHIGLASAKLGRSLNFDPKTEQFIDDDEANAFITREYRDPFIVPEIS